MSLLIFQYFRLQGVFWMGWECESAVRWAFTLNERREKDKKIWFLFLQRMKRWETSLSSTCSQHGACQVMVEGDCCFLWAFLLLASPFIFSLVSQQGCLREKHTTLLFCSFFLQTKTFSVHFENKPHKQTWARLTSGLRLITDLFYLCKRSVTWSARISLLKHSLWNSASRDFFFGDDWSQQLLHMGLAASAIYTQVRKAGRRRNGRLEMMRKDRKGRGEMWSEDRWF